MHLNDAPNYLTYEQYADLIGNVQYKPGWQLSVFNDPYEGPCLYLVADVVDGYDHSKTVPLRIRSNIPHHRTPGEFYTWLQWRLIQVEIHECREYFHVDDEPWSDPHDVIEPYPDSDTERTQAASHPFADTGALLEAALTPWTHGVVRSALDKAVAEAQQHTKIPSALKRSEGTTGWKKIGETPDGQAVYRAPIGTEPPEGKAHPDTMAGK